VNEQHASPRLAFGLIAAALVVIETVACATLFREPLQASGATASPSRTVVAGSRHADRGSQEWHVSPEGRRGHDGTAGAPLDLATVLSKDSPVQPGDTIWLHGGTYRGTFISEVAGAAGSPVIVRQWPGERATLDGAGSPRDVLLVNGSWTWYWDFEITNSDPQRSSRKTGSWPDDLRRGAGVTARGSHVKFINLVVHDTTGGFGIWEDAVDTEAYGNLIYFNGWVAPDRGHGHGIYTQNALPATRLIRDNIIFDQFSHGIHAFGSERAALDNIVLAGNVAFNNGSLAGELARDILLGGGSVAHNPVVRDNFTYGGAQSNIGYAAGCENGVVAGNYFGQGPFILAKCTPVLDNNSFAGTVEPPDLRQEYPGNTFFDGSPPGTMVRLRPNEYEPGRANLVVYNWERRASIQVDLSAACQNRLDRIEVRNAQDYFGAAVASGSCANPVVELPMADLKASSPVGRTPGAPGATAPEFAVFVVLATR
jgi:hypothetical protein